VKEVAMEENETNIPGGRSGIGAPNVAQQMRAEVGNVVEDARGQVSQLVESARSQAAVAAEQQKEAARGQLSTVAGALRQVAQKLEQDDAGAIGAYASGAADQVERVARYLKDRDLGAMRRDTETFARRHPDLFLGGAFVAGLLAARFLKSSGVRNLGEPHDQPANGQW
jgi:hypothetical protein